MLSSSRFLYLDITDYLVYFCHFSRVSGIQRVELNLISYLEDCADILSIFADIKYCLTSPRSGDFAQVTADQVRHLQSFVNCEGDSSELNQLCRYLFKSCDYKQYPNLQDDDLLVLLGPPFATPYQLDAYISNRIKSSFVCIAVCHDLLPLEYPEFFPASLPSAFATSHSKLAKLVDGFICNSNYTKSLVHRYDLANQILRSKEMYDYWRLGDCSSIGHYPDPAFVDLNRLGDEYETLKAKSYVLIVSTLEPRKNHETVLRAWRLLINKANHEKLAVPSLVFVGKKGWNYDSLLTEIRSLQNSGVEVYHLDGVSDGLLKWLYSNCLFTIMPSYAEGLGLSILESHGYGKICVASNVAAMPEAASPYSPTFDPYSSRDLFDKICDLLYAGKALSWRQRLESRDRFTWLDSSRQFYRMLAKMYTARLGERGH